MRVGIYSGAYNETAMALGEGFALVGAGISHRNVRYYRGEVEDFDLVVSFALREGRSVLERYGAAGRPALVADWGYLARVNQPSEAKSGHYQIGLSGLNQIPTFACPSDRFDALGVDLVVQGGDPNGYVLLCGQVPGDAAHGLGADEYVKWLRLAANEIPGCVYRPHPLGGVDIPGIQSDRRSLAESLAGARLVVTYNSNVGHDALLAGIPVVAHGQAAYSELAGESLPSVDVRREYFSRVAYGQWTRDEMRSGQCQRFVLDHLLTSAGPAIEEWLTDGHGPGVQIADINPAIQPADTVELPAVFDLDAMNADELHALAKERGVKVHHKAGADKVRAALRGAAQ